MKICEAYLTFAWPLLKQSGIPDSPRCGISIPGDTIGVHGRFLRRQAQVGAPRGRHMIDRSRRSFLKTSSGVAALSVMLAA